MFKNVWIQRLAVLLALLLVAGVVFSQPQFPVPTIGKVETVFIGIPETRTTASGIEEDTEFLNLTSEQAQKFDCVITKKGDKYFWTTRDNREMEKIEEPGYITFRMLDRPDYVRIVNPKAPIRKFGYVEHITFVLGSINYHGQIVKYQPD